jgi:hypothetical protein
MSRLERIIWIDLILSSILSAGAYALGSQGIVAFICILAGCAWIVAFQRRWQWAGNLILIGAFLITASGVVLQFNPYLLAFSFLAALNGWDLIHFSIRVAAADRVNDLTGTQNVHLRKLLEVDIFSSLLMVLALTVQLRLPFGWILLLGMATVIVLTRLIKAIQNQNL